ncbi:MAG: CHAD domain-containing protein [Bryobacterales bacterium]|nr:CHAD domain-containing protein [Bryobacterales bacterium]
MKSVASLIDALEAQMQKVAELPGVDAVHDLRVSVRRAAEGLRIFTPEARKLRNEIRAIREHAANVRDRDVTRQLLRRHRLPATDPACVYLQGQRDLAASQLRQFLALQLGDDRPARWRRWIGEDA